MKNDYKTRRGAMMLMMLVIIIIGSIIALQMLPSEEMITRRSVEKNLDVDLSQLREAFDLAAFASEPIVLSDDPTPQEVSDTIASLTTWGYLRSSDVRDSTVPPYQWGTGPSQIYWKVSKNYAANPSFETYDVLDPASITRWVVPSDASATADATNVLRDIQIDDYPYQNKLTSDKGFGSGACIKIQR